jgi:glutathione S-transferase
METHLKQHDFFVARHFTIADIALYAYTHVAEQCDFELTDYPAIRGWIERVQNEPGYVPMEWTPEDSIAAQ